MEDKRSEHQYTRAASLKRENENYTETHIHIQISRLQGSSQKSRRVIVLRNECTRCEWTDYEHLAEIDVSLSEARSRLGDVSLSLTNFKIPRTPTIYSKTFSMTHMHRANVVREVWVCSSLRIPFPYLSRLSKLLAHLNQFLLESRGVFQVTPTLWTTQCSPFNIFH